MIRSAGGHHVCCTVALLCLGLLAGCGDSGPKGPPKYDVKGTVLLDGQPLEQGQIRFLESKGGGDGGEIKNGAFAFKATAGSKRVEITAQRVSDTPIEGKVGVNKVEDLIPAKYNTQSELKAEVAADKPNDKLEFQLTK